MERRLAAILAADVVGFSRLTEADEEGTLHRLKFLRSKLLEPTIAEHRGRIVKLMGDGLLAEFASVVDAVRCAVAIQRAQAAPAAEVPQNERIALRIGVNLGDIVIDDDDVYGDCVNIASRLEALAEPGGVCLSGTAFDHVKTKLDVDFESLGAQRLKNIEEPVRTYRVLYEDKRAQNVSLQRFSFRGRKAVIMPATAILVVIAGVFLIWRPEALRIGSASVQQTALPLPDKPSIAVLPFANTSDDPDQEYFADGMSEDLITDLSKISGLFVIARNSAFAYKDQRIDVRDVARDLGVKYVLEGSVRRSGDQVRINAQLIDGTTGAHLWADRYDGEFSNVFALQDRVTERIVEALSVNLNPSDLARKVEAETSSQAAYDAFLRGWAYYRRQSPEAFAAAIPYFEKALDLDPGYGRAHAALAAIYWQVAEEKERTGKPGLWLKTVGVSFDEIRRRGDKHLEAALDDPTPLAHQVAADLRLRQSRHDEALSEAQRGIELDPNDPVGHEALARALIYSGRPAEAAEAIRLAMRLDPNFPPSYLVWLGLAQFGQEQYEEAAGSLRTGLQRNPDEDRGLVVLTAVLGHLGKVDEAQSTNAALNDLRERRDTSMHGSESGIDSLLVGPYTLREVDHWPFKASQDRERLRRGLDLAGVPAESESGLSPREIAGATTVDAEKARELHAEGVPFVDVRTLETYKLGHIPGATLLDLKADFTVQKLTMLIGKDQRVVIYCEGPKCLRSSEACAKAVSWGFEKVHYFRDGFPAWRAAGYPVEVQ